MELLSILYAVLAATLGWDGTAAPVTSRPSLEAVEQGPAAAAIACTHRVLATRPTLVIWLPSLAQIALHPAGQSLAHVGQNASISILTRLGRRRE